MARKKIGRLATISIIAVPLAVLSLLQSASIVASRTSPDIALQLAPHNGHAYERKAFAGFTAKLAETGDQVAAARNVEPFAAKAVRYNQLSPNAHAILAIAAGASDERKAILGSATALNRRAAALQGLALEQAMIEKNTDQVLSTLDQILRVHPEVYTDLFPVLSQVLADDEAGAVVRSIFASDPPWRDQFFAFASRTPAAVPNLAILRRSMELEDEPLDARLVEGLARAGDLEGGFDHYEFAKTRYLSEATPDLRTDFPPFDWSFSDTRNLRAQLNRKNSGIEFQVRSGAGGELMRRLYKAERSAFSITINTSIEPAIHADKVRLRVRCAGASSFLFDQLLATGEAEYEAPLPDQDCGFVEVSVSARVFQGEPTLRGLITKIDVN